MEYIETYLIISFKDCEEIQIRTWLDCGHYPNAIDHGRNRIIVFNMCADVMCGFVKQFNIKEWSYGQSAVQPDEYTELFRYYDSVIWENIVDLLVLTKKDGNNPYTTFSQCHAALSSGFKHDGYLDWENRFYLSKGLLGLSVKTFKPCKYPENLRGESVISELKSTLKSALDEASGKSGVIVNPVVKLVIRLWMDFDPYRRLIKRVYIGWMVNSNIYVDNRRFGQNQIRMTLWMQNWLRNNGLHRNASSPDEIQSFLENTGLKISDLVSENMAFYKDQGCEHSKESFPFVRDVISIPFLAWETPEKFIFDKSLPYAIDHERNVVLLLNHSQSLLSILKELNKRSMMRIASYIQGSLPQYKLLCHYVNEKIKENLNGVTDSETWFDFATFRVGISALYRRKCCYSGTHNINVNQLKNNAI